MHRATDIDRRKRPILVELSGRAHLSSKMGSYDGEITSDLKFNRTENNFSLPDYKVPFEFREPYILSGYRRPQISARECLHSLFKRSNETINVWSSLAALSVFVCRSIVVFKQHNPFDDVFFYPLLSFVLGSCSMFLMSAGAHLFNAMSSKTRHVCFFFDYAAISVYAFSVGQAFYFYSRPLNTDWLIFRSYSLFVVVCVFVSILSTYACCASRHRWIDFKFLLRTGTFASSFFINTLPYWVRMYQCTSEVDCNVVSIPYFKRQFLLFAIGAFTNGSRLPERLIPGVFDFFGQSHHFMHILCAIGTMNELTAINLDMLGRRKALEDLSPIPTFSNSLCLTLLVLAGNIAVVFWFTKSIKSTDNEDKRKARGKEN
ncbi:membrane progestin receptor gamma-B-like [Oculina patagonica]